MSATTTSAPSLAKSFALTPFTSLVSTRAAKPPFGSFRMARTKPLPCAPVAPTTAMTFLSLIVMFFPPLGGYADELSQRVLTTRPVNLTKGVELYLYLWHRVEFSAFFSWLSQA